MIKITILALVLALPLAGGFVGPEIPVSTPVMEPAPGRRDLPRVASNGSEFLVVWRESNGWVRAARVDADGVVVDREPLELDNGRSGGGLDVASDGRDFVVVHQCGDLWMTCVTRVDARTGSFTLAGTIVSAAFPAIASNGKGYMVAYHTHGGAGAIPLHADGSVAGAAYPLGRTSFPPAVASNGDGYFVVAGTADQLDGFLLTEDGPAAPRQRFSEGAPTRAYGVASDGDGFLVTWGERVTRTATELRVAQVSPGGLASPSHALLPFAAAHALAWHATRYVVAYTTPEFDIASFDLSATGQPASAPVTISARPHREDAPALASNGRNALAVWTRHLAPHGSEIEARLLGSDPLPPSFVVSHGVPAQQSVAATRRGTLSVVAWDENAGPDQLRKVYVQRLDATGLPLDGRGNPVGDSPRHQVRPALAGSVIAWIETETLTELTGVAQVWASRLDFSGRPAGMPFLVGEAEQGTRVAVADPGGPLQFILWSSPEGRIMAVRFDPYSRVGYDPAPFAISSGGMDREVVAVSNGAGFLVAWKRVHVALSPAFRHSVAALYTAAFTQWGDPLGTSFELTPVNPRLPALVWNGAEYVVFWSPWSGGRSYAQRVSATGTPIGAPHPIGAPQPFGRRWIEAAAWTGTEYRLALRDKDALNGDVLQVVRRDRDFLPLMAVAPIGRPAGEGAVLLPDLLLYLTQYRSISRVVARRLGDDALPRRRTTAPR